MKFDVEIIISVGLHTAAYISERYCALELVIWRYIAVLTLERRSGAKRNIGEMNICILETHDLCQY